MSDCIIAEMAWGCPWNCIYEALSGDCDYKKSLRKLLSGEMNENDIMLDDATLKDFGDDED